MDDKTLDYMGKRVDRARELNKKIEELEDGLDKLGDRRIVSIRVSSAEFNMYLPGVNLVDAEKLTHALVILWQETLEKLHAELMEV